MLPDPYDDGGLSGGSLARPALQQLLDDVQAGKVDQIVVYKIDRLTRSLADFAKIVDVLNTTGTSFVSVTQSFNTATSMGRLTLNMLLSFAQFEREVTAERIRDKIAASKRKGLWMGGQVPLGYDADGRTLKINEPEADTVRLLYDLYEQLGKIRTVKEEADRLGLRSRRRKLNDGTILGGGAFDRGHIHHILTNPIYAGRIRHRDKVHAGQHKPIIDPERWDAIQQRLQSSAARTRGLASAKRKSLLSGKLFDETGDRLTPSHSKTRTGTRLRYYVSHRLVAKSGERQPGAWRLPAEELERGVADLVRSDLSRPRLAAALVRSASAEAIAVISSALTCLSTDCETRDLLPLVQRVDIAPGSITLEIAAAELAQNLAIDADAIMAEQLTSTHPFQLRKRGVETRIILDDAATGQDETLIRNIARAHVWFERIKAGETFAQIAKADGTSKRRIQQMIDLAFLAPDIVRDVIDGKQPLGFTSEWLLRHTLPSDWQEQRSLVATL